METIAGEGRQRVARAVESYGRALFAFIRRRVASEIEAEDILQDVWLRLASQPEVEAIDSVSGWLYRVARNLVIDRGRAARPAADRLGFEDILLASDEDDPALSMLRDLFWDELATGLDALPPEQRLVFVENEIHGKTLQRIADEQRVPLKTIISRKRYAVQRLRARLAGAFDDLMHE